jgi:hypothetical protein
MTAPPLARAYPPRKLAAAAFDLYETFRPTVHPVDERRRPDGGSDRREKKQADRVHTNRV